MHKYQVKKCFDLIPLKDQLRLYQYAYPNGTCKYSIGTTMYVQSQYSAFAVQKIGHENIH
jgi:hypothetical protein